VHSLLPAQVHKQAALMGVLESSSLPANANVAKRGYADVQQVGWMSTQLR
jgi:hypothetical protein